MNSLHILIPEHTSDFMHLLYVKKPRLLRQKRFIKNTVNAAEVHASAIITAPFGANHQRACSCPRRTRLPSASCNRPAGRAAHTPESCRQSRRRARAARRRHARKRRLSSMPIAICSSVGRGVDVLQQLPAALARTALTASKNAGRSPPRIAAACSSTRAFSS